APDNLPCGQRARQEDVEAPSRSLLDEARDRGYQEHQYANGHLRPVDDSRERFVLTLDECGACAQEAEPQRRAQVADPECFPPACRPPPVPLAPKHGVAVESWFDPEAVSERDERRDWPDSGWEQQHPNHDPAP